MHPGQAGAGAATCTAIGRAAVRCACCDTPVTTEVKEPHTAGQADPRGRSRTDPTRRSARPPTTSIGLRVTPTAAIRRTHGSRSDRPRVRSTPVAAASGVVDAPDRQHSSAEYAAAGPAGRRRRRRRPHRPRQRPSAASTAALPISARRARVRARRSAVDGRRRGVDGHVDPRPCGGARSAGRRHPAPRSRCLARDERLGVGLVVDQADLGEPVEHRARRPRPGCPAAAAPGRGRPAGGRRRSAAAGRSPWRPPPDRPGRPPGGRRLDGADRRR